ncbi:GNAT family N-acetyltransferase [Vannielia litorea]|uniref:GNAT family N-acetyltransferase n=1 Tax=Vannielia litorea TaxID=1217970 RepID=UPI001BCE66E1|nr:GNAT family N-acetyltransferase [Vannielia litorea]MBS8225478.1 GNAT family N-acetyltransferase [Vannielia litorea]
MPLPLEVRPATEADRPVIANLLQFYLYDMAEWFGTETNAAGRYEHEILDEVWAHPYLFSLGKMPVGFALLTRTCTIRPRSPCWYIAEFGVLRPYWRRGIGRRALGRLFAAHPGEWEITWYDENRPAAAFWPRVIPQDGREQHRLSVHGIRWTSVAFSV